MEKKLLEKWGQDQHHAEDVEATQPGFVIVTTSAIQNASSQMAAFAAHKASQGFDVHVVTESVWGGGTGDTAAENLRSWLQANYVSMGIQYVLLIGDPDPATGDVPMKMLYPRVTSPIYAAPSDTYYADLTGNWNLDGDDRFGEYDQDFGVGGVDRNWEVIVGRVPYYGAINELDTILQRSVAYQTTPQTQAMWRKNVLLPMAYLGDWSPLSDFLGEYIKDDILADAGWSYHRIYEDNHMGWVPPPETMPCTEDLTVDVWKAGSFGLVVWFTHGSATSAADVIDSGRADELNDAYKAFTFQASCNTAWAENDNNLAYELLKHGAISTIGATRNAWSLSSINIRGEATIEGMAYEYATRVVPMGKPGGMALNELRQEINPSYYSGGLWANYVECNLYGDPSASIYMPEMRVHNTTQDRHYPVIQWAVDEAQNGDVIVLDVGTYTGFGNREIDFKGKAITVRSADPANPSVVASTIVDGQNEKPGFFLRNNEDENAVIAGLTITRTTTGIRCDESSPNINDCVFENNDGRGIDLENSDAKINRCRFIDNGGGIDISNGSPQITDCTFTGNSAAKGGAVYCFNGHPLFDHCTMTDNSATTDGGAVYGGSSSGRLTFRNCTVFGNRAGEEGGGFYIYNNVSIINTIISGNSAGTWGGGIYIGTGGPIITNATLHGNRASAYGGGICCYGSDAQMVNTISWANQAGGGHEIALMEHYYFNTALSASHCDVQGGEAEVYVAANCNYDWQSGMDDDPQCLSPGHWDDNGTPGDLADDIWVPGDYHLTSSSPCIDRGSNAAAELPDDDFDGDPRVADGDGDGTATVDIGVDEYAILPCEGNFDADGDVDGSDLAVFAADFGRMDCAAEPPCEGDFNGDNDVDGSDLAVFAADFGRTDCP
jgi:predicted outer membrane repeat protein